MSISKVAFDPGGPSEFYVDFKISNLGPPSTIENWNLTVKRDGVLLWRHPPRVTFSLTADPTAPRGYRPALDLSKQPVATGEQLTPHFTWTYEGNAKDNLEVPEQFSN